MYQQQCKDVFAGGVGKAVETLKHFRLDDNQLPFWTSAINLGGDYAWMLLALAKAYNGELENTDIIQQNWDNILKEETKFWQDAGLVSDKWPEQFFFWTCLHSLCHEYIDQSLHDMDNRGMWHPYGFLSYLSSGLMISWEFHTVLQKEAEKFENMRDMLQEMFDSISELTNMGHRSLSEMRLQMAQKADVFGQSVTYTQMYSHATSIKDFRNALFQLCGTEMLKDEMIDRGINGLLRDLAGSGRVEIIDAGGMGPRPRRGGSGLPPDIDGIKFDD